MESPQLKKKIKKEIPSSPWNETLPTKMEHKLYTGTTLKYKGNNSYTKTVVPDVLNMETIELGESSPSPGKSITFSTVVKGFLPLRIVSVVDEVLDESDHVMKLKCHGIDFVGNSVQILFQNSKNPRSPKNVQWALTHCIVEGPNEELVASNKVYLFEQVKVKEMKSPIKYKFSGKYLHELVPQPYHRMHEVNETDDYDIPLYSLNPIPLGKIVKKEIKVIDGIHPNVDVIGVVEDYYYDQMNDEKPCTDDYFNIYLSDEENNIIFIQAKGVLGLRMRKYVKHLGGIYEGRGKVLGLRNLEHSHGPHRSNVKLDTFFFQRDSEPYNLEQLRTLCLPSFTNFLTHHQKLYEEELETIETAE